MTEIDDPDAEYDRSRGLSLISTRKSRGRGVWGARLRADDKLIIHVSVPD